MFPARGISQVAPSRDDERDYRCDKKDRVGEQPVSVQRDGGGRPDGVWNLRSLQKEVGLAKRNYSDCNSQPYARTTQNIRPTLLSVSDGKTQKIQHRQIQCAGGGSLSDREFRDDRVTGRKGEMEGAEPRDDHQ